MPDKLKIIPATAQHVDAIKACAASAYALYIDRMQKTPAPMVADFAQQVDDGQVFVALLDDTQLGNESGNNTLAGYAVFYPVANAMHLENIAVVPTQQGTGIGKRLIDFVEHQAQSLKLVEVQLYTNVAMQENIALYGHLGYEETERRTEDGFERVYFRKWLV